MAATNGLPQVSIVRSTESKLRTSDFTDSASPVRANALKSTPERKSGLDDETITPRTRSSRMASPTRWANSATAAASRVFAVPPGAFQLMTATPSLSTR